jgi:hypothetical protein
MKHSILLLNLFSFHISKPRILFTILCLTIFTLIVDTSIDQIYYLDFNGYPLTAKVILFMMIAIITLIGQYAFLHFVKDKSKNIRKMGILHIFALSKIAYVIQLMLIALFLLAIFQMIIETQYNVVLLIISIGVSYFFGISMLILLSSKFFSWFRSDKNLVVLFYGTSSTIIASNMIFSVVIVIDLLLTKSDIIFPHFGWRYAQSTLGPLNDLLTYGESITSILGFVIAWVSTLLLLRQFSVIWKGKAHWIIVTVPLIYFLIQFQPLFLNIFSQLVGSQPVYYGIFRTLFITYSQPIGGLIFGGAFWSIARKLHRNSIKMDYITISAFGFILLFVSNQALLLSSASYPPFGLATTNFLGLSCYMVIVGIYSSAISIAQNTKLRTAIRKLVENESNLLDSIGATQMTQTLEKKMLDMYNSLTDKMHEDDGVMHSLSEEEVHKYFKEVIEDISKNKESIG